MAAVHIAFITVVGGGKSLVLAFKDTKTATVRVKTIACNYINRGVHKICVRVRVRVRVRRIHVRTSIRLWMAVGNTTAII